MLVSALLAIHAEGRGSAQAMGTLTEHGVRQVERLLSNRGVDVWTFVEYWTPYVVGVRTEVVVALDWRSFAADEQDTIVLAMVTGHGIEAGFRDIKDMRFGIGPVVRCMFRAQNGGTACC